jgi:hypothetical protein
MKNNKNRALSTEQEYIGTCHILRKLAQEIVDSAEHSIRLYDKTDEDRTIISKQIKTWTKWDMERIAEMRRQIEIFTSDILKDRIDPLTCEYTSKNK